MTHTFRHPKYHKEMRAKRRKLQASKPYQINQASSPKQQAPSVKLQADKKNPE